MSICSQQELPEQSRSSLVCVHTESRQQLGRLTAPLHFNPCICEDMWGEWEYTQVTFHANVFSSPEPWLHHLNEVTCFLLLRKEKTRHQIIWLEHPHLTSESSQPAKRVSLLVVEEKTWRLRCHLLCISLGLLWRCPASMKNIGTSWRWNDAAQSGHFRGHRAFGLAPQPTAAHTQSALQWNLFMPLEKKWNLKGRSLLFFFFPWLHHKRRAGTMEALGCCGSRLRRTAENAQDYYEDMPAAVQSSQNDPHS